MISWRLSRGLIACGLGALLLFTAAGLGRAYSLVGYTWPSGTSIVMHLQLSSRPAVPLQDGSASWDASAADALAIWNQYMDNAQFVAAAPGQAVGGDGASAVFFSGNVYGDQWPTGTLAVTINYSEEGSGVFTETDVIFNNNLKWNSYRGPVQGSGPTGTWDLHRVALHEFGHVLGLDHPDEHGQSVTAIMNSIISDLDHLATDDISGAQSLYGIRITSPLFLDVYTNQSFSYQISANNNPTSFEVSGLPPGLDINTSSGLITGVPTSGGTFHVTLVAHGTPRDATGTLRINISTDAHFTNPLSVTGNVGDSISLPLTTSQPVSGIVFNDPLPNGLRYDNANRTIYGSPIFAGNFNMKISATTGSGTINATLRFEIGPRLHDFPTFLALNEAVNYYHSSSDTFYTPANQLSVTRDEFNRVVVSTLDGFVRIYFQGGGFEPLHVGTYDGAISSGYFSDRTVLDIQTGNQCDQGSGKFTVKEIIYGPKETILSFWATFEQHCSGGLMVQHIGEIRYHVDPSDPLVVPVVTAPASVEINEGESISIQPSATNGATSYSASGLPLGLLFFPNTGEIKGTPTVAGTFVVRIFATNSLGTGETDVTITIHPGPARPHSLLNISTRGHVGTGDDIMIGGFIITGTQQKTVVMRGMGPSIPVTGALENPAMRITFPAGNQLYTDNWLDVYYPINSGGWGVERVGLAPGNRLEPAVLLNLTPGPHTIGISGVNNTTGVALAEAYDITPYSSSLANISTRARVGVGDEVLIGGFIVGGDQPTRLVLRAMGPTLSKSGVPDALPDPTIELHDGNGAVLAQDDDWRIYQEQQLIDTGLAPPDDREAAMLLLLEPGAYTAIVRGKNDTTGVGLVEIYNLDAN